MKLDCHSFKGVFIECTKTMKNIRYINLKPGVVKTCGHGTFDEVWYCLPSRPPAAQLMYDLGIVTEDEDDEVAPADDTGTILCLPCPSTRNRVAKVAISVCLIVLPF